MRTRPFILAFLMLISMAAVGEPQVRRVVLDEEPPPFDYWDLTEAQRASYAVFVASPDSAESLTGSGSLPVSISFDIRRDALSAGDPALETKPRELKGESDGHRANAHGVEDEDGNIVGVLECNYSAGIPRINYRYDPNVEADASGSCQYHVVAGDQPDWIRWDMVLLLQRQPGNVWEGQETYSQTDFSPSWSSSNTTVEGTSCFNQLWTNTVPVFVAVPDGFSVIPNQPVGLSLAWAFIVGCPTNPFF